MFRQSIIISNKGLVRDIVYYPQINVVTYNYVLQTENNQILSHAVTSCKMFSNLFNVDSSEIEPKLFSNKREAHDYALSIFRV